MSAYNVSVALSGNSEMLVTPRKPGISDPLVARPHAEVFFVTSPIGAPVDVPIGEGIVTFTDTYYTSLNTPITFQAFVNLHDPARIVVEYLWNFGDGTSGWGPTVVHTYVVSSAFVPISSSFVQASVRVTDDQGRHYYARQQIYLPSANADGDINILL